ncbi:hypothetical protein V5799_026537, partial [Amblyomma americanum]
MKFRELETLSVALHLAAFVLLVDPRSSRDVILIDVATMHVIDLFPSGSSAKYLLPARLYLHEASQGPWVSEAAGGVCSSIPVAVLEMKFRELETLSVALHLAAFVLLVDPRSSRDVILIDVATMHVIDLFPSGSSSKYLLPATLYLH